MYALNTRKSGNLPPSRYDVESKYRIISDLSNKLEGASNKAKLVQQLYSTSTLNLRQRLTDEIKVIFRYAPVEYGQICEEILWKRNYYDYVQFFKRYRKQLNADELNILRMHLIAGIGHYSTLFLFFRKSFNLTNFDDFFSYLPNKSGYHNSKKISSINYNITGGNDFKCSTINGIEEELVLDENIFIGDLHDEDEDAKNEWDLDYINDEKFVSTISFLVHRFCICIGDLARYYVDFFPKENAIASADNRFSHYYFNVASFWYRAASIIKPTLGMPFNQLGTLYSGSFWGLDSLYFYVRCLHSKKSFSGAKGNMRQVYESARRFLSITHSNGNGYLNNSFKTKNKPIDNPANQKVKEAIATFILFFSEMFNLKNSFADKNFAIPLGNLVSVSNSTLEKLALALNVEPSRVSTRSSPSSLSTESIFQIISIFAILVEQIETTLKENSIDVKFEVIKSIKSDAVLTDNHLKGNFILYISYRFLFQFVSLILQRESKLLGKWLSCIAQYNLNEKLANRIAFNDSSDYNSNKNEKQLKNKPIFATSFSSDFNDIGEDSVMLNQLKSTAIQSIVSLFDQSDNEEADEPNELEDDSDNESVSDLIDKLILSDDENHLMEGSLIDEAIGRNDATANTFSQANKPNGIKVNATNKDSITMDQLLVYIYTQSHTPVIKFFCDFLQSNKDFMDVFEHLDVLPHYFEVFSEYLNHLSEFDLKLITNFSNYLTKSLTTKTDPKKLQSLNELNALIVNFSKTPIKEFDQKYPLSCEVDYLNITEVLRSHFDQMFDLSSDPCTNYHQINLQPNFSCEQYGYICTRFILVFGIKLALIPFNFESFKISLEDFDSNLIHNMREKKAVKFVVTRVATNSAPFGLTSAPLPISKATQPLINFNDPSDKDSSSGNEANFVIKPKTEKKKSIIASNVNDYKSLYALSKLPFVMIDPYVYLENLSFVRDLVLQKKAFLVVPKLATDFLNNLKEKNENAKEASDFLSNEFFRGSRMIRFIRNDDRMELEMLKYPRYQWRRDVDTTELNENERALNNMSKVKVQDLALFYELLEHCHYLLVNKVLVDKYQETMPINGNSDLQNIRITLITNNLSKWPTAAATIAESYDIDLENMNSFIEKQTTRFGKPNKQIKSKKPYFKPAAQHQSPMFFKPIQNTRAEMFVSHPLT